MYIQLYTILRGSTYSTRGHCFLYMGTPFGGGGRRLFMSDKGKSSGLVEIVLQRILLNVFGCSMHGAQHVLDAEPVFALSLMLPCVGFMSRSGVSSLSSLQVFCA